MSLKAHYNDLYSNAIETIKNDTYTIDKLIDASNDKRFGITLLARPPLEVKTEIQDFITKVKAIEPNQYYYKNSDIHITVMSIISCYEGFGLDSINIEDYIDLITRSLQNIDRFKINFKGITAAPTGIMTQGFIADDTLNTLRSNLRKHFKSSDLQQSIDKRYTIQTAHSTIMRFKDNLKNKLEFLKLIEAYRIYNFGTFEVEDLELVFNDWYQREELVKKLYTFKI